MLDGKPSLLPRFLIMTIATLKAQLDVIANMSVPSPRPACKKQTIRTDLRQLVVYFAAQDQYAV